MKSNIKVGHEFLGQFIVANHELFGLNTKTDFAVLDRHFITAAIKSELQCHFLPSKGTSVLEVMTLRTYKYL
jgi:hypothetical protein